MMRAIVFAVGLLLLTGPVQAQDQTRAIFPNHQLTPGGIDQRMFTPAYLCAHPTSDRRRVPLALRHEVFAAYGVSYDDHGNYEVDHFVPLSLGGVNSCPDNHTCNLWPQPHQKDYAQVAPWGSETKDKIEGKLYTEMCNTHTHKAKKDAQWLVETRQALIDDWQSLYRQYFGEPSTGALRVAKRKRARRRKH